MLRLIIWPLLPISMDEMPSIMMLFWPAPPIRVAPADAPPACTPGVSCVKLVKFPWLIGRFSICSVEMANDRSADCDCTSAASAVTFTVSAAPPISSVSAGTATRSPPLTLMSLRRTVLNPCIEISTMYVSAVTFGMTYMPLSFVATGPILVPFDSLIRTTVAPGTTPPCESFTVPDTLPVVIWAETGIAAPSSNSSAAESTRTHPFITHHLRRDSDRMAFRAIRHTTVVLGASRAVVTWVTPLVNETRDRLSRLVRNVPALNSIEMSPSKPKKMMPVVAVENCSVVFQGAVGACSSRPRLRQLTQAASRIHRRVRLAIRGKLLLDPEVVDHVPPWMISTRPAALRSDRRRLAHQRCHRVRRWVRRGRHREFGPSHHAVPIPNLELARDVLENTHGAA